MKYLSNLINTLAVITTLGTGCATVNSAKAADSETNPTPAAACFAPANTLYQMVRQHPDKTGCYSGPVSGRFDPETQKTIPQQDKGCYAARNFSTSDRECTDVTIIELENGNRSLAVKSCNESRGMYSQIFSGQNCFSTIHDGAIYKERTCSCQDNGEVRMDTTFKYTSITPPIRDNYETVLNQLLVDARKPRYVSAPKTPQNPPRADLSRIIRSCITDKPLTEIHWSIAPACLPENIVTKLCYGSNAADYAQDKECLQSQESLKKCITQDERVNKLKLEDVKRRLACSYHTNQAIGKALRVLPNIRNAMNNLRQPWREIK